MASVANTSPSVRQSGRAFSEGFCALFRFGNQKHRTSWAQTSALCGQNLGTLLRRSPMFSPFHPLFFILFPSFFPHFREKPPRNSSFSSRRHPSRCAPPSFFATKRPFPLREGPPGRVIRILGLCLWGAVRHPCSLPTAHTASAPHSLHLRPSPADSCNVSATA